MTMAYLTVPQDYWETIPMLRELPCGRVKFADHQHGYEFGQSFLIKAYAVQYALANKLLLIRETQLSDAIWQYQLLLGGADA